MTQGGIKAVPHQLKAGDIVFAPNGRFVNSWEKGTTKVYRRPFNQLSETEQATISEEAKTLLTTIAIMRVDSDTDCIKITTTDNTNNKKECGGDGGDDTHFFVPKNRDALFCQRIETLTGKVLHELHATKSTTNNSNSE